MVNPYLKRMSISNNILIFILLAEFAYLFFFHLEISIYFFYISIILSFGLLYFLIVFVKNKGNFLSIYIALLSLFLVILTLLSIWYNNDSLESSYYFLTSIIFLYGSLMVGFQEKNIKVLSYLSIVMLLVSIYYASIEGTYDFYNRLLLFFENPNSAGTFLYTLFIYILLGWINKESKINIGSYVFLLGLFISLILIYLTGNRSSIISVFLVFLFIFVRRIFKKKIIYYITCIIFLLLPLIIVAINLYLYSKSIGSFDFLGKNIFSGREIIWDYALYLIAKEPLMGYGVRESLGLLGGGYHNMYISILLKYGLLVLIAYIALIYKILKESYYALYNKLGSVALFGFLAMFFQQSFEETIINGAYGLFYLQYFLLVIAYSYSKNYKIS